MDKVLVIQGAGMQERGKTQVEIFGPETLAEINADISVQAEALGLEVDIFQSDDEAEVVAKVLSSGDVCGVLINPSGFTTTDGPLPEVLGELTVPVLEIHASNPSSRGVVSTITPKCRGSICGFGYAGYRLGLEAIRTMS